MFKTLSQELIDYSIFGDARLEKRFGTVISTLGNHFGESISQSNATRCLEAGFYRFMNNKKITHARIVMTERDRLKNWVAQSTEKVILSINDTTEANYTGRPVASKLDCLTQVYLKGYFVHSQLLATGSGLVEGVYDQVMWGRKAATLGDARKSTTLNKAPLEDRESYRWLAGFERLNEDFAEQTDKTFIHMGDRESDLYELMAMPRFDHIHYLFRAQFNRKLSVSTQAEDKLFSDIARTALKATIKVSVPTEENSHVKREATLEIRYAKYTLSASGYTISDKNDRRSDSNFIELKEVNTPKDVEPIHWRLMTSLPIDTIEQVLDVLKYYLLRWRIEEFHVVLKQGCAIEKLNFETPQAIENLMITYSIIAAKILNLRYLHEQKPEEPIEITGYSVQDYNCIAQFLTYKTKKEIPKLEQPKVADIIMLIQRLGSGNKYPKKVGIRALWLGVQKATTILDAFKAFKET
jgi:Transposase DNA-binding/Transposase DDE domain